MQRVLSFEQTPALNVPLRFFLSAPVFAVLAALVLFLQGPSMLASRWTPSALAFTHLLTLGFLAMSMIGALLQILPVVAGIDVPHASRTAAAVHGLLAAGTLALASAFLAGSPWLVRAAMILLTLALGGFLAALLKRVWVAEHRSAMLDAIRHAMSALAVAAAIGAVAAAGFAWPVSLPLMLLTDLHVAWGLLGWVGLLVVGVAYQVVPMFQVTPQYPAWMMSRLAQAVLLILVLWTAVWLAAGDSVLARLLSGLLAAAYAAFAAATFHLLRQRKRPRPDATTYFWRTALVSLCGCVLLWVAGEIHPALSGHIAYPLSFGMLAIVGFGYSVINGMLYKIVPFLVWYHLQNRLAGGATKAPNVRQILPDASAENQFRAHLAAVVLLTAAPVAPQWLAQPAALIFGFSSAWLGLNLMKAARLYRDMARAQLPVAA